MNLKHLNKILLIMAICTVGCFSKDCKEIEEKDIVGFYVSMNSLNEDLQYLEILKNGIYYNKYCKNGELIVEKNEWEHYNNCTVTLANIYWLNDPRGENGRGGANFGFNYGKILSMGDDVWSFKKSWFKPTLKCE